MASVNNQSTNLRAGAPVRRIARRAHDAAVLDSVEYVHGRDRTDGGLDEYSTLEFRPDDLILPNGRLKNTRMVSQ
jgi:hypothetical protein